MKKLIVFLFVTIASISIGNLYAQTPKPDWVQTQPQNTGALVYFVGKSDRAANYENFLEAKAGAIIDVLFQFSMYKGADVNTMIEEYTAEAEADAREVSFQQETARILSLNECTGLYQQAEWMDGDGILYLLCSYAPGGRSNPLPDLSDAYEKISFNNDRTYFAAMAVSSQDNAELAIMAEQSAKMQSLLWLGANISVEIGDYTAATDNNEIGVEHFSGDFTVRSRINYTPALSFREESRRTLKGQDNKFYFYGIYSISNAMIERITEYDFFSYSVKYSNSSQEGEAFQKLINFNGKLFSRDKPYTSMQVTAEVLHEIPESVLDFRRNAPENCILGIGIDKNASREMQMLRAGARAVSQLTQAINSTVYFQPEENISTMLSPVSIAQVYKVINVLAENNSTWQVWWVTK